MKQASACFALCAGLRRNENSLYEGPPADDETGLSLGLKQEQFGFHPISEIIFKK